MQNEEFGGEIQLYKRPFLQEFLTKVSQLGVVSIFTQTQAKYADPILDCLDPERKFFKHRFYGDSCVSRGDGQILKDMSVLQTLVGEDARLPENGRVAPSLW